MTYKANLIFNLTGSIVLKVTILGKVRLKIGEEIIWAESAEAGDTETLNFATRSVPSFPV